MTYQQTTTQLKIMKLLDCKQFPVSIILRRKRISNTKTLREINIMRLYLQNADYQESLTSYRAHKM